MASDGDVELPGGLHYHFA